MAIADFAILSVGVSVAIHATETTKGAEYVARDAEVRLVFVGRLKPDLPLER